MRIEHWRYILPLRLRSLLQRRAVEQELDDELRDHVEQQTRLNIESGMPPAEARTQALRALGGLEQHKEACRDQRGWNGVDNTTRDVRHGIRVLRRSPVFTVVAMCTLALGIGANAAIFQLIDVLAFKPLPIEKPSELAVVRMAGRIDDFGVSGDYSSQITNAQWERLREHTDPFTGVFAWANYVLSIGDKGSSQRARTLLVSGNFFPVLRVPPARGRLLTPADDRRGCGEGPVVVSRAFEQTRFGGESAVGRTLTIQGRRFTVVGVAPETFTGLEVGATFDIALPVCAIALWEPFLDERHRWLLTVMGRLKPEWTPTQASEYVGALSRGIMEATIPPGYDPAHVGRYLQFRMTVQPASRGISRLRANYTRPLWLLLGATGLVLLITCANLATLMLARADVRGREIAVRVALGAARSRIVSQLSVESVILAAIGAVLAIPVALLSSRALATFLGRATLDLSPDWRIVAFTGAVAAATVLIFGVVPALRASIVNPIDAMRHVGRGFTGDRRRAAFQRVLVIGQIAVSLVLVVSALLFVRSFRNLSGADPGFPQDNLYVAGFFDDTTTTRPLAQRLAAQQALTDEIRSTPGVVAAAAATHVPLSGSNWWHFFRSLTEPGKREAARWTYISPGYFATLRIPFVAGRDFTPRDTVSGRRVAIVNQAFARAHVGAREPIGAVIHLLPEPGYPEADFEIVGVVRDTMYTELREGLAPIVFSPMAQHPDLSWWPTVMVRTNGSSTVGAEIARRVAALDHGVTAELASLSGHVRGRLVPERMLAWLGSSFGALSMTLAAIGLYGLIAYLAVGRRHEIGVRLSLGATRQRIIGMMLRDSAWLVVTGLGIGLPVAVALMRAGRSLLFGLSPTDGLALGGGALLLAAAGVLAALIPAWRASRLDPTMALRND